MINNIVRNCLFSLRDSLVKIHGGVEAQDVIAEIIKEGKPLMLARFGAVEIKAVVYSIYPPCQLDIKELCLSVHAA